MFFQSSSCSKMIILQAAAFTAPWWAVVFPAGQERHGACPMELEKVPWGQGKQLWREE